MSVPKAIRDLADMFDKLPGVGPRAALRYAYWLAGQNKTLTKQFSESIDAIYRDIVPCSDCGMWTDASPCHICSDPRRDPNLLCVVATSQDIRVMEEAGVYQGKYFVLGGLLDPIEGRNPDNIQVQKLIQRIKNPIRPIQEIILALDPDVMGDTTSLYIIRQLSSLPVAISRLARGIPTGAQIEYADEATITDAYLNRRKTERSQPPA